jgi:hypothetical protein
MNPRIKIILIIPLLMLDLTGCVGYTYSRDTDAVSIKDLSLVPDKSFTPTDSQYLAKPNRNADKIKPDGSEIFTMQNGHTWCGLTVWAIIPIPIWLPGCRNYIEVTYKNGTPIRIEQQTPALTGRVCGPFMPWIKFNRFSQTGICPSIE